MNRKRLPLRLSFMAGLAVVTALPLASATVAFANDGRSCADIWFSRNLVFHRAGYCFKSNLGKAIFGNDGCRPAGPRLSATDRKVVAELKEAEGRFGCRVDSTQRRMSIPARAMLEALERQPIPDDTESACLGYRDAPMVLRAGPSSGAARIGTIRRGDNVSNGHYGVGGWNVYTVTQVDGGVFIGWTNQNPFDRQCEGFAG